MLLLMAIHLVYQNIHETQDYECMLLPVAGLYLLQETLGGWRCFVGSAGIGILYVSFLRPVQTFRLRLLTSN